MAPTNFLKFKNIKHIGNDQFISQLESNLKVHCDWALLGIGGWTDVNAPTSGAFGGDFNILRLVDDPSYTDGQVWEGARKDWVYETGVGYIDATGGGPHNPNVVGIPTVDAVAATTGTYHVNYPLGRIIFDTAESITAEVKVTYAMRDIQVYRADDAPWFRELQFRSYRLDDEQYSQVGSGNWSMGSHHRVQFPAVIIEVVPRSNNTPYEMGNGSLVRHQDVLFHVLAESRWMRNTLLDIFMNQDDKAIYLFDGNKISESGDFPLDFRGELVGTKMYPDLVEPDGVGYRWKTCHFTNAQAAEIDSINPALHQGVVRLTAEVVLGDI